MIPASRFRKVYVLILPLACVCGCGESVSYSGKVRGTATLDGKPLTTGRVVSLPLDGGRGAVGEIQRDGTFVLSTEDHGENVVPGQHRLAVIAYQSRQGQEPFNPEADLKSFVPQRYTDPGQSGLSVEVVGGEEKVVALNLVSEKRQSGG